jgi:hypothetical protein
MASNLPILCALLSAALMTAASAADSATGAASASPLTLTVSSRILGDTFGLYMGGGTDIEPPGPLGGGDGIPVISISEGHSFTAGSTNKVAGKQWVKIACDIHNPTTTTQPFLLGELCVSLTQNNAAAPGGAAPAETWSNDFVAVGYNDRLCAVEDEYRLEIKSIAIQIGAGGSRTIDFLFLLPDTQADAAPFALRPFSPPIFPQGLDALRSEVSYRYGQWLADNFVKDRKFDATLLANGIREQAAGKVQPVDVKVLDDRWERYDQAQDKGSATASAATKELFGQISYDVGRHFVFSEAIDPDRAIAGLQDCLAGKTAPLDRDSMWAECHQYQALIHPGKP